MKSENKISKPLRILQILPSLNQGGGIQSVVINWHRNIDKTKVQFDYLFYKETSINYDRDIKSLKGKYYKLPYPSFMKLCVFIMDIIKFFRIHKYNTIHSHIINLSFLFYPIAKFYGVKNIIQHSHNTKWSDKILKGLINKILFCCSKFFVTTKISCSDLAGKFLFNNNYTVINNGIATEKFKFNEEMRNKIRKELNIENKFIIGNIGRFEKQKNHNLLIDIFNEIYKRDKNSVLLLIGDGLLKKKIKQKVDKLNLTDNVIFTGIKTNVNDYYQSMDVFILPSLYEGLGIVAVEAQCSGLPCFISDGVPDEVMICNTTKISLSKHAKEWAKIILENTKNFERRNCSEIIKQAGFDIKDTSKQIEKIYLTSV